MIYYLLKAYLIQTNEIEPLVGKRLSIINFSKYVPNLIVSIYIVMNIGITIQQAQIIKLT